MALRVSSSQWKRGETIPKKYTGDGADISPPLAFEGVPQGTKAFALICDDPDAPVGTWVHWVIYDIPGTAKGLPEGVAKDASLPDGSRQGRNSWKKSGYGGPSPPPGKPHRYFFRLYALREPLGAAPGLSAKEAETAARTKSIESAEYMGTYGRT
ncbi:MAG TPA: YbhB/YbcL family Raf kinase inhibitor-like protein [Thermoplasmata archaeon]|jgi:Raf kinase inhibitor-like YbhB/YbcL family protein